MTNNSYIKHNLHIKNSAYTDHTSFGGIIYTSDFNTDNRRKKASQGSSIAARIVSDWRFDRQCMLNSGNQKQNCKNGGVI